MGTRLRWAGEKACGGERKEEGGCVEDDDVGFCVWEGKKKEEVFWMMKIEKKKMSRRKGRVWCCIR